MWAIVPLKSPAAAKSRLAVVLTPPQRQALFFTLAFRVLDALRRTPGIDGVAVVTSHVAVGSFARNLGADVIYQRVEAGTAPAFVAGITRLRPRRFGRVLMVAGDLPLISPGAVQAVLEAAPKRGVVLVPDRRRSGTNALLCAPPDAIAPAFGVSSLRRHLARARAAAMPVQLLEIDELAWDLDLPEDLDALQHPTCTFPLLHSGFAPLPKSPRGLDG